MYKYTNFQKLAQSDKNVLLAHASKMLKEEGTRDHTSEDEKLDWLYLSTRWDEVAPFTYNIFCEETEDLILKVG